MSDVSTVWFRSKVDWWLGILLFLPPIASLATLWRSLTSQDRTEILVAASVCGLVTVLYALFVIPVRYGLGADELIVRFGVFRQRVRLADIEEVRPTHNPLSSPALSLDRLAIRTGPGILSATMISPADRQVFLRLLSTNARLRRDGDRLVRD